MVEVEVSRFGYITVDTSEWFEDISTEAVALTESAQAFEPGEYANPDVVGRWLAHEFPGATLAGLYGEDGPLHVATCNYDTLLDTDVSFTLVSVSEDNRSGEWGPGDYLIITGYGYGVLRMADVEVRQVTAYDSSVVLDYVRATFGHAGNTRCPAQWSTDDGGVTLHNSEDYGSMPVWVEDCIEEDDGESEPRLICPECGGTLAGVIYV